MFRTRRFFSYVLAVLCLLGDGFQLSAQVKTFEPANASNNVVSSWEMQMNPVRQTLPPDVFIAGYLESSDIPDSLRGFYINEFFMTQYALAPVVLKRGTEQNWIIGNFGKKKQLSPKVVKRWLDGQLGNYSIQDFGSGIYLIHRLEK